MSIDELEALFEKHESEFGKFDNVGYRQSKRRDLNAFLLLDNIAFTERGRSTHRVVAHAEHDKIWLGFAPEDVAAASEDQIIDLIRCGVMFDRGTESFFMFV